MPSTTVRGLLPGDSLDRLEPLLGALADISSGGGVVVARGGAVEGAAIVASTPAGRRLEAVSVAGSSRSVPVLVALAEAYAGERIELLARDADERVVRAAVQAGFTLVHRQVRVAGALAAVRPQAPRPLTFRPSGSVGRRGMLAVLESIWAGGPAPTGLAPEVALAEFLEGGDTSLWRVAYHRGEPAGAILPLLVEADTGVLQFIGILPGLRGRGLGRALHAEALWLLRSAGARRYRDSTAVENLAMRRIFTRAGCAEIGTSVLLVRRGRVEGPSAPRPRLPLGAHVSLLEKVPIRPAG